MSSQQQSQQLASQPQQPQPQPQPQSTLGNKSHRQLQQPSYQQAVMGKRLNKNSQHHWASTRQLVTEVEIDQQAEELLETANMNRNLRADCETTVKKKLDSNADQGGGSSKKQHAGSLQSARMRHLQQPHSFISSDEKHLPDSGSQKSDRSSVALKKQSCRVLPGFNKAVKLGKRNNRQLSEQSNSQQRLQQISSARTNISKEAMTPALQHGTNNFQSVKSQIVLDELHGTKTNSGTVNAAAQNYRYHSQQISKARQRPSAIDFNYNSNSSTDENNLSFIPNAGGPGAAQYHNSGTGRLIFKRQEKNQPTNNFNSGTLQQRQSTNLYHPAPPGERTSGFSKISNYTGQKVAQSLDKPNFKQYQSTTSEEHSFNQPHSTQKAHIGDNKRESTLKKGYLASPRSDEQQRFRARVPSNNSQMSFDMNHVQNNYQSVEELKTVSGPISTQNDNNFCGKTQRSLRRINEVPPGQQHQQTATQSNGGHGQYSSKTQQRISRKLVERIGSQQVLADQKMMNIREEFSGHKVEGQEQKLVTLSKQSIPALSTKQFLESGSLEGVSMRSTRSRQRKDQQLKQGENLSAGNQPSFPIENQTQRRQWKHARNHASGTLHQHSSSVLPSHRHLLSSVNVLQPKEELQHYQAGPNEEQKASNIYNSQVVISGNHSGSSSNLYLGTSTSKPVKQKGSHRYSSFISAPVSCEPEASNQNYSQEKSSFRSKNQTRKLARTDNNSNAGGVAAQFSQRQSLQDVQTSVPISQIDQSTSRNSILVSKVQQKNQQFKFQFRHKSQQSNNFKRQVNRINQQLTPAETSLTNQAAPTAAPQSRTFKSQRISISKQVISSLQKTNTTSHEQIEEEDSGIYRSASKLVPNSIKGDDLPLKNDGKKRRNQKLLSSASPPQTRFLNNKVSKGGPKPSYMIPSNENSDCGSDFAQMGKSRGRLQSVAIQSSSFSKRLSDNNEKPITSSQNSGGNISGLTLVDPQKPPNTPLKQSMQSMQQNFAATNSGEENATTQKPAHSRVSAVYENIRTKKRQEKQFSAEPRSDNHTTTRTHQRVTYIIKPSSGANTSSADGSSSDQNIMFAGGITNLTRGVNPASTTAKDNVLGNRSSEKSSQVTHNGSKVTSYNEQGGRSRAKQRESSDVNQQPYIVRQSAKGHAAQVTVTSGIYDDLVQLKTVDTNMQSFSLVNEDAASSSGGFNGQNSLHSAQNIVKNYDDQLNSIESGKQCLSKTSSMNNFKKKLGMQMAKIQVISEQASASQISMLQDKIKERDLAYSSLKTQFEQLRNQVEGKERNSSQKKAKTLQKTVVDNRINYGQVDCGSGVPSSDGSYVESTFGSKQRADRLNKKVRDSLHSLKLAKQRSNSESNLQNMLSAPRMVVPGNGEPRQIASDQVSDADGQYIKIESSQSKLKQPTKFSKSRQVSSHTSAVQISQDRSAPQISIASAQKVVAYKAPDQSKNLTKERNLQRYRGSLPPNLDGIPSRQANSNDSKKIHRQAAGHSKDAAVLKNQKRMSSLVAAKNKAPQNQKKGVTTQGGHTASIVSLVDKDRKGDKSQRHPHQAQASKQQPTQAAQQKQSMPVKKAISKAKTTTSKNNQDIVLSQTNKLAIQNLKQVINSTSKKLNNRNIAKKNSSHAHTSNIIKNLCNAEDDSDQKKSTTSPTDYTDNQAKLIFKTQDLRVIVESFDERPCEDLPQESIVQQSSQMGLSASAAATKGSKFTCAGKRQESRLDTEPVLEAISLIQRQESIYKEETPSNEQSQNSSNHPTVPFVQAAGFPLQNEESKEFKATGTAFGQNNKPLKQNQKASIAGAALGQQSRQVNCFGVAIRASESGVEQTAELSQNFPHQQSTSGAFPPRHSDLSQQQMSQQSATFANGNQSLKQPSSQVQVSSQNTEASRCETPIHPNQEVDGIKFLQVEDPDYKTSNVFDLCQDDGADESIPVDKEIGTNCRASTPIMPLNSTGKEFFAAKKKMAEQEAAQAAAAVQIQKSSIQILKQLQKKKQGMVTGVAGAAAQRGRGQHPKVVVSQNNPFFVKTSATKSSNASANSKSPTDFSNCTLGGAGTRNNVLAQPQFGGNGVPQQHIRQVNDQIEFSAIGQPNTSIKFANLQKSQQKTNHNSSMVSHEIFYSPMQEPQQDESPPGTDDIEENKDYAVEILSQTSITKAKAQAHIQRRQSQAAQQFGAEESTGFQVSQIEHAPQHKRDDILDDSLLFALQEDTEVPKNRQHLEDADDQFVLQCINDRAQASDKNFFAKQMSLQPEILQTPISVINHEEKSNLNDLIPSASKFCVGDGLIIEARSSTLSLEMAALDGNHDASPGLKKRRLDKPPEQHSPGDDEDGIKIQSGALYHRTTDKKAFLSACVQEATFKKSEGGIRNIVSSSKGTEMMSGNNLTYSASPSAINSAAGVSISEWTSQKINLPTKGAQR